MSQITQVLHTETHLGEAHSIVWGNRRRLVGTFSLWVSDSKVQVPFVVIIRHATLRIYLYVPFFRCRFEFVSLLSSLSGEQGAHKKRNLCTHKYIFSVCKNYLIFLMVCRSLEEVAKMHEICRYLVCVWRCSCVAFAAALWKMTKVAGWRSI